MDELQEQYTPVTQDNSGDVAGPFYHGTKSALEDGTDLVPGYTSNFQQGRVSNNIYFTTLVETAAWGAQLAAALDGSPERGHIYIVEPIGEIEDDPNLTDKRFPGNPTHSYRTREPVRIVSELQGWTGHSPDQIRAMRDGLADLQRRGTPCAGVIRNRPRKSYHPG